MTKLEEVMDENFVFAKYFQDSFIALPLPFNCDIWMHKKQPDFYNLLCVQCVTKLEEVMDENLCLQNTSKIRS